MSTHRRSSVAILAACAGALLAGTVSAQSGQTNAQPPSKTKVVRRPVIDLKKQAEEPRPGQVLPGQPQPSPEEPDPDAPPAEDAPPDVPAQEGAPAKPEPEASPALDLPEPAPPQPTPAARIGKPLKPAPIALGPEGAGVAPAPAPQAAPARAEAAPAPEAPQREAAPVMAKVRPEPEPLPVLSRDDDEPAPGPETAPAPAPRPVPVAAPIAATVGAAGAPVSVHVTSTEGAADVIQWRSSERDVWSGFASGDESEGLIEVRTGIGASASLVVDSQVSVRVGRLSRVRFERREPVRAGMPPEVVVVLTRGEVDVKQLPRVTAGQAPAQVRVITPDKNFVTRTSTGVRYDAFEGTRLRMVSGEK